MVITDTSHLAPKTRIVATTKLPGVPEGTPGKLGRAVGLTLTRYRVSFDNGVDISSVTHFHLVKEDEWDEFREQREADAESAAESAAESGETAEPAPEEKNEGSASPADDRLAALLAKSKAAKEKRSD